MSAYRRHGSAICVIGLAFMSGLASVAQAQDVDALLRQGDFDAAIEIWQDGLQRTPNVDDAVRLAEVLVDVGRSDEAERLLRDWRARAPDNGRVALELGHLLQETGRFDEASPILADAVRTGDAADQLLAELYRGEILFETGQQEAALEVFDTFIDYYNVAPSLGSRELYAIARAVQHLGITNTALYPDALRAFDEAIAADPDNIDAHVGVGMLFLQTYSIPDARDSFGEALNRRGDHPEALLGMALTAHLEGNPEAAAIAERALEVNPNLVGALVLRARIRLSGEDADGAEEDLSAALEVNPASSEALGILAAARYLRDRPEEYAELRDRALEINPRDAEFFVTVAELAATRRLYRQAVEFADQAVRLDSLSWQSYGTKGLNQLRTGEMADGRRNLEISFAGDPYNVWIKNTLDLLDLMDTFEEYTNDRVWVLVDPEDGEPLARYLLEVGEAAYEGLSERYGYEPEAPVRIEAFRRSSEFSVRTVGMAGMGALGVAFGTVVAMDSPAARGTEGFHWASTLWHEMAHVVHLGLTDHRVPRWLSEGLAVHEERVAHAGWGYRPSISFFIAYLDDQLRPPSELSLSFVRPRSPEEVGNAYILGSLVSGWIEERWGFDAVLGMMDGYREGLGPEAVIERELGVDFAGFDREFHDWLDTRYAGAISAAAAVMVSREASPEDQSDERWLTERVTEAPEDIAARMALAGMLLEADRFEEAEAQLIAARDIFPENPDPAGPHRRLAELYRDRGDVVAAEAAFAAYLFNHADDYRAHLALADLRDELGDVAGVAEALEGAIQVYPFEIPVHERLAEIYRALEDPDEEITERQVVLALDPADRTGAYYRLGDAFFRTGRLPEAREAVLGALAIAPRFPEAQDLLLRIMEGGAS